MHKKIKDDEIGRKKTCSSTGYLKIKRKRYYYGKGKDTREMRRPVWRQ